MSMEMNQKSGNNSQLIQAQTVNNYIGITEAHARLIFQEEAKKITVYTQEALDTAFERIDKFENAFMQAAKKVDGALETFSDPAFQILLRDAAQKAAATERDDDYDLLSQLLICHIQKGNERKNRAGIHRAIQIVDEIDNEALCALTIIHAVTSLAPITGKCCEGLKCLDDMFSKLLYMDLPIGIEWLDHLDILGTIRIKNFGRIMPLAEYYSSILDGYVCVGIKKDSPQFETAIDILSNYKVLEPLLIENECLEGYVRLALQKQIFVNDFNLVFSKTNEELLSFSPMPKEMKDALYQILGLYSKDPNLMAIVKQNFERMLGKYEHLSKIQHWWATILYQFEITSVGKVLSNINAKRCDPNLPDLDL